MIDCKTCINCEREEYRGGYFQNIRCTQAIEHEYRVGCCDVYKQKSSKITWASDLIAKIKRAAQEDLGCWSARFEDALYVVLAHNLSFEEIERMKQESGSYEREAE